MKELFAPIKRVLSRKNYFLIKTRERENIPAEEGLKVLRQHYLVPGFKDDYAIGYKIPSVPSKAVYNKLHKNI